MPKLVQTRCFACDRCSFVPESLAEDYLGLVEAEQREETCNKDGTTNKCLRECFNQTYHRTWSCVNSEFYKKVKQYAPALAMRPRFTCTGHRLQIMGLPETHIFHSAHYVLVLPLRGHQTQVALRMVQEHPEHLAALRAAHNLRGDAGVIAYIEMFTCVICEGAGWLPRTGRTCRVCDGEGTVRVNDQKA